MVTHRCPPTRDARSKAAARDTLVSALRDRVIVDSDAEFTPETRLSALAEAWFAQFSSQDRSPTTLAAYRDRIDRLIIPALGQLRLRELTVSVTDRFIRATTTRHGSSTAKQTKTVLSQICALAVRHDVLVRNPVPDTASISTKPKRATTSPRTRSSSPALLTYDDAAITRDIPDLISFMLATGLRIGEASAVRWQDLDDYGTVAVTGTVIRTRGTGLMIKPAPKTRAGTRTPLLPAWCAKLLRRRATNLCIDDTRTLFPAPKGGLRDPSNTAADLKAAFTTAGYPWATAHTLRKTTATLLDQAGLSAREIADQLGHARPSITQDIYMARGVARTSASGVLENLS